MAESKGFEPLTQLPVYRISSAGRYNHFDNSPREQYYTIFRVIFQVK